MRKIVLAIILIALIGIVALIAYAQDPTWLSNNAIWNRVFDSANNRINVIGV